MHKDAHAPVVSQNKQTNNYTNLKFINTIVLLEIIKKFKCLKIWMENYIYLMNNVSDTTPIYCMLHSCVISSLKTSNCKAISQTPSSIITWISASLSQSLIALIKKDKESGSDTFHTDSN